jgi:hypothetical protein
MECMLSDLKRKMLKRSLVFLSIPYQLNDEGHVFFKQQNQNQFFGRFVTFETTFLSGLFCESFWFQVWVESSWASVFGFRC